MGIDPRMLPKSAQEQILRKVIEQKAPPKKKYHNEQTERNGIKFDSKREAERYDELMLLLQGGEIRDLRLQPEYTLQEAYTTTDGEAIRAVRYRADFSYERKLSPDAYGNVYWLPVVEDVKGMKTDVYLMKRKMFQAKFGFAVTEVR